MADVGSDLDQDVGTMTDYSSIQLDRENYPFTVYHYPLSSVGTAVQEVILAPFSGMRCQPATSPMLTKDLTPSDGTTLSPLSPVTRLNWSFTNNL